MFQVVVPTFLYRTLYDKAATFDQATILEVELTLVEFIITEFGQSGTGGGIVPS